MILWISSASVGSESYLASMREKAKGKIMQDNIWVYNLYADVYDDLELIEFDAGKP